MSLGPQFHEYQQYRQDRKKLGRLVAANRQEWQRSDPEGMKRVLGDSIHGSHGKPTLFGAMSPDTTEHGFTERNNRLKEKIRTTTESNQGFSSE